MNVSMGENLLTISKDTNNLNMKVVRWWKHKTEDAEKAVRSEKDVVNENVI